MKLARMMVSLEFLREMLLLPEGVEVVLVAQDDTDRLNQRVSVVLRGDELPVPEHPEGGAIPPDISPKYSRVALRTQFIPQFEGF